MHIIERSSLEPSFNSPVLGLDMATCVVAFLGDPATTARVCRVWKEATDRSYLHILYSYQKDPILRHYVIKPPEEMTTRGRMRLVRRIHRFVDPRDQPLHVQGHVRDFLLPFSEVPRSMRFGDRESLVTFFSSTLKTEVQERAPRFVRNHPSTERIWQTLCKWTPAREIYKSRFVYEGQTPEQKHKDDVTQWFRENCPSSRGPAMLEWRKHTNVDRFFASLADTVQRESLPEFAQDAKMHQKASAIQKIIDSWLVGIQPSPLYVAPLIPRVEDANLVKFFEKLSEGIDDDNLPEIPRLATVNQKARTIRAWMNTHPEILSQITDLNLSGSDLSLLPREIALLPRLERLDLSNNRLTDLPSALSGLRSLVSLNLRSNRIEVIPDFLRRLPLLTDLNLSYNQLSEFPEFLTEMIGLTRLEFEGNFIETLPRSLGRLVHLTHLNLGQNRIRELPESIGLLEELLSLQLQRNQLRDLPLSMANLERILSLSTYENQLGILPQEILDLPARAIHDPILEQIYWTIFHYIAAIIEALKVVLPTIIEAYHRHRIPEELRV